MEILIKNGVDKSCIEYAGYHRLKLRPDGFCILFCDGECKIHSFKPETCVAGPFTFDVSKGMLEIYLKKESICPMVSELVKDEETYRYMYEKAVEKIQDLVSDLPPDELSEILKIEEPETVLVGVEPLSKRGH